MLLRAKAILLEIKLPFIVIGFRKPIRLLPTLMHIAHQAQKQRARLCEPRFEVQKWFDPKNLSVNITGKCSVQTKLHSTYFHSTARCTGVNSTFIREFRFTPNLVWNNLECQYRRETFDFSLCLIFNYFMCEYSAIHILNPRSTPNTDSS